jgi:hypothetical protein
MDDRDLDPARWQLAQVNIALPQAPIDSEQLRDFVDLLEPINALAERSDGFVWRLVGEEGDDATSIMGFGDDRLIINMSVWASLEALADYVFGSDHAAAMRRRREWFEKLAEAYTCLLWVPTDHRPTVAEAEERLASLRTLGPTPYAFTFRRPFPPADDSVVRPDARMCDA